jgi:hypothetical protein
MRRRSFLASALALVVCSGCVSFVFRDSRSPTLQTQSKPGDVKACEKVIAGLAEQPDGTLTDPIFLLQNNILEPLPLVLRYPTKVAGLSRYDSVDQYLSQTAVPNASVWRDAMTTDGYVVAEAIGYQAGPDFYGAEALKFGSKAKALDFQRKTLLATCQMGLIRGMEPVPKMPGSVVYTVINTRRPPYRASIVIGVDVVHLNLCECVETNDPISIVRRWAIAIEAQLGVSS